MLIRCFSVKYATQVFWSLIKTRKNSNLRPKDRQCFIAYYGKIFYFGYFKGGEEVVFLSLEDFFSFLSQARNKIIALLYEKKNNKKYPYPEAKKMKY